MPTTILNASSPTNGQSSSVISASLRLIELQEEVLKIVAQALESITLVYDSAEGNDGGSCEDDLLSYGIGRAQTGFIVDGRYVVTALHGLRSARPCIVVGNEVVEARRVYRDVRWDIAVLDLGSYRTRGGLRVASRLPFLGEIVLIVGMNRGQLAPYVQLSMVSSTGLTIRIESRLVEGAFQLCNAVPKGLSGAPVINVRGEVVGMIVGIDYEMGHSFAVPSLTILSSLRYVYKGLNPSERPLLGIKVLTFENSLLILNVSNGSAKECGLKPGDRIVECFDGEARRRLKSLYDLWQCLDNAFIKGKTSVHLKVLRNGVTEVKECRIR